MEKAAKNAAFFRTMRQDVGIVSRRNGRCRGMEVAGMSRYYLDEMDAVIGDVSPSGEDRLTTPQQLLLRGGFLLWRRNR